jgi:hypothetical protein
MGNSAIGGSPFEVRASAPLLPNSQSSLRAHWIILDPVAGVSGQAGFLDESTTRCCVHHLFWPRVRSGVKTRNPQNEQFLSAVHRKTDMAGASGHSHTMPYSQPSGDQVGRRECEACGGIGDCKGKASFCLQSSFRKNGCVLFVAFALCSDALTRTDSDGREASQNPFGRSIERLAALCVLHPAP